MSYILIIGAKSDIARACAQKYAENGYDLYLAARNSSELKRFANHLTVRTAQTVECLELDLLDQTSHQDFYQHLEPKPLGVISAVGYLGDQKIAEKDSVMSDLIINTNYTGIMSLFNLIANDFEQRKSGFMVGISSVAGDRGRQTNYLYGAAKAALSTYLSGLRNRLYAANVQVLTVKPGFVDTQMTEGMDLPKKLTANADEVAADIYHAQQKNKNIIYSRWIWRWIMFIIKIIPEWQFKKMKI